MKAKEFTIKFYDGTVNESATVEYNKKVTLSDEEIYKKLIEK